jgi:hypothetical protein
MTTKDFTRAPHRAAVAVPRSAAGCRRTEFSEWRPRPFETRRNGHGSRPSRRARGAREAETFLLSLAVLRGMTSILKSDNGHRNAAWLKVNSWKAAKFSTLKPGGRAFFHGCVPYQVLLPMANLYVAHPCVYGPSAWLPYRRTHAPVIVATAHPCAYHVPQMQLNAESKPCPGLS